MLPRENYQLLQRYHKELVNLGQLSPASLQNSWSHLLYILHWAGSIPLQKADKIKVRLSEFLLSARSKKGQPLSAEYIRHIILRAVQFFQWLAENEPKCRTLGKKVFLDTLRLTHSNKKELNKRSHIPAVVLLEAILAIASTPAKTLCEKRARAAICWLYLSGQRAVAFITTPLAAINMTAGRVSQTADYGVQTKGSLYGITYLLPRDEVLAPVYQVVEDWVALLQQANAKYFFAKIDLAGQQFAVQQDQPVSCGDAGLRKDLDEWCQRNHLTDYNLHAFRHGYAHYLIKLCRTIADLQWLSMNLLHEGLATTTRVYLRYILEERPDLFSSINQAKPASSKADILDEIDTREKYQALSPKKRRLIDSIMDAMMTEDADD